MVLNDCVYRLMNAMRTHKFDNVVASESFQLGRAIIRRAITHNVIRCTLRYATPRISLH